MSVWEQNLIKVNWFQLGFDYGNSKVIRLAFDWDFNLENFDKCIIFQIQNVMYNDVM